MAKALPVNAPPPIPAPPPPPPPQPAPQQSRPAEPEPLPPSRVSRFFGAVLSVFYAGLVLASILLFLLFILTMDFLDIVQFRYLVPEKVREKWPISAYYEFVKYHQLPDEERLLESVKIEKEKYNKMAVSDSADLKRRREELEKDYLDLMQKGKEYLRKVEEDLNKEKEEVRREREKLEKVKTDMVASESALETKSKEIEFNNLDTRLRQAKLKEEGDRLKPMQEMTSAMDPRAVATVFDEVSDSKLIYDILKGMPPERSALILSFMDPERAGKIVKMTSIPTDLPGPMGGSKSPNTLGATAQPNLR